MKPLSKSSKQRGAVLAFTLLMLLLLTTISVNMVQQNQQSFTTANNARQQVAALSTLEATILANSKLIDVKRYCETVACGGNADGVVSDTEKALHKCNLATAASPAGQIHQGIDIGTSEVIGVYCLQHVGGREDRCAYASGARVTTDAGCNQLTQSGTASGCPVEVYELETSAVGDRGAKRTIRSKYAVNCTGDTDA